MPQLISINTSMATANDSLVTVTEEFAAYCNKFCNKTVDVFTDRGDIAYIEIVLYKDGISSFRDCAPPDDVAKWLASNIMQAAVSPTDEQIPSKTLKLLIVPLNYDALPYSPFPEGAFDSVARSFNLSEDYLSSERLQSPSIAFNVALDDRMSGFVMKAAKWNDDITHFCQSSVFDARTMHSSCILRISLKEDLRDFKARLEQVAEFAWYPYFIAAILLEKPTQKHSEQTEELRRFLYGVEKTTGTHKNHENRQTVRTAEEAWTDPKFQLAPGELTSVASDCIKRGFSCPSRKRLLHLLKVAHEENVAMGSISKQDKASRMLTEKLKFMTTWIEESESRFGYIGKRAEVQTQMCHGMMAQRDNALNKRIAETSLAVSRNSRQDSANMSTIALAGFTFLPATFTATMFSTDFFNFQGEGPLVSHWFWVYWATTLPLTLAMYMVWYFSIHRQRRETVGLGDDIELARLSSSDIV
ncbi:hypothetical protein BKA63DRAFT_508768 [Paraphoma chrysanthemicola]|nr:hypothetical protein BKA63DRAFT_508768 [Paraphoma chrysanthemicola]